jgi:hypothetical protein
MQATIQIPKAFSVRDDQELIAFRDLMARLSPRLHVSQVAIGRHLNGAYTVYWGLVHLEGQKVARAELDAALREAGFDFKQCASQIDYSLAGK